MSLLSEYIITARKSANTCISLRSPNPILTILAFSQGSRCLGEQKICFYLNSHRRKTHLSMVSFLPSHKSLNEGYLKAHALSFKATLYYLQTLV